MVNCLGIERPTKLGTECRLEQAPGQYLGFVALVARAARGCYWVGIVPAKPVDSGMGDAGVILQRFAAYDTLLVFVFHVNASCS